MLALEPGGCQMHWRKTHDKRNQTTTLLGVSRATPWRKMKEIGLDD
jgi:transcriptional regulator of acetoin/glycerol metabolism